MNQASDLLDEQIAEIQRLSDTLDTTGASVDRTREEVANTTKEVNCQMCICVLFGLQLIAFRSRGWRGNVRGKKRERRK